MTVRASVMQAATTTASAPPDWDFVPFDVACARCGHDLRGQSEPKCPACELTFDWSEAVHVPAIDTSLIDRSSFGGEWPDYVLTFFVPPIVFAGNVDRLSEALTGAINRHLGQGFATLLKDRLLDEDWTKPVSVAFISPDPLELVQGDSITLELEQALSPVLLSRLIDKLLE